MSFSNIDLGVLGSTQSWTLRSFRRAVRRGAAHAAVRPDIVYAHFVVPGGFAAVDLARTFRCPAVIALGESSFDQAEGTLGSDGMKELLGALFRLRFGVQREPE